MMDIKKVVVGGLIAVAAFLGLSAMSKGQVSLFDKYMDEIAAASTREALDAIRWRFEADYITGKLTYEQYMALYNYYVSKIP